jgi:hypothetical protein
VDADDNQVQLTLTLDSGPLFLAGELRIVGLQLHEETTVRNLAGFGAPGCFGRVSTDSVSLITGAPLSHVATFNLGIPNNTAFVGTVFFTQGLALSPGTNALGVIDFTLRAWLPPLGDAAQLLLLAVESLLLCWIMLFRGFLFRSLARSGRRQRIFGARMRGL